MAINDLEGIPEMKATSGNRFYSRQREWGSSACLGKDRVELYRLSTLLRPAPACKHGKPKRCMRRATALPSIYILHEKDLPESPILLPSFRPGKMK